MYRPRDRTSAAKLADSAVASLMNASHTSISVSVRVAVIGRENAGEPLLYHRSLPQR